MFDSSPELFAVFHAFLSLLTPRHPPCALSSLTTFIHSSSRFLRQWEQLTRGRYVDRPGNCRLRGRPTRNPPRDGDGRSSNVFDPRFCLSTNVSAKANRPSRSDRVLSAVRTSRRHTPRGCFYIRCHSLPQPNCQRSNRLRWPRQHVLEPPQSNRRWRPACRKLTGKRRSNSQAESVLWSPVFPLSKSHPPLPRGDESEIKWETPNLPLSTFLVKGLFENRFRCFPTANPIRSPALKMAALSQIVGYACEMGGPFATKPSHHRADGNTSTDKEVYRQSKGRQVAEAAIFCPCRAA